MEKEILSVSFKDVGKGDCIILEWTNDAGERETGIVDCGLHFAATADSDEDDNKAITHLKSRLDDNKPVKIKFIVLSHPHMDHFLGMRDLINFCLSQRVTIENVYHTSAIDDKLLEKFGVSNVTAADIALEGVAAIGPRYELKSLFQDFYTNHEAGYFPTRPLMDNVTFCLNEAENLTFKLLSPQSEDEVRTYVDRFRNFEPENGHDKNGDPNNIHANLLSSVISIETPAWRFLLTSDATLHTLDRIDKMYPHADDTRPIIVAQMPDHGSTNNHNNLFWDSRIGQCAAVVISCGGDVHPHPAVVSYLKRKNVKIMATNTSGGLTPNGKAVPLEIYLRLAMSEPPGKPVNAPLPGHDVDFWIGHSGGVHPVGNGSAFC